ncbi:MAG: cell surface protein SprA [Tannerellaceae bacterium]|nr:cell surface protein SprA [Tannerellaceae bacterium]
MEEDSLPPARYPVAKTAPQEYEDILKQSPADLRDPENVQTFIEYDLRSGSYIVRTRIGDMEIGTPMTLTPEEYQDYSMQQSLREYFRQKNEEEFQREINKEFNIADMQFDIGPAEKVFGPGGVRVRTQGSADVTLGLKRNTTKNPSLPARSRSRTFFNFDESVQLNVQATVGTKVNFDMNYNTETSFDFDSQKLKLAYTGEEDEIIRSLEAGNVSMTTSNSLIRGGAALFGMKADLQFGKLRVNALFAQQESESRTVNSKGGAQTRSFEITVDQYDENRHFFLAHYFRDNYDQALEKLPYVKSAIEITRIEVWVTNKRGNYDQARNIVAFSDLAEGERAHVGNTNFVTSYAGGVPENKANNLYQTITGSYNEIRDISLVNSILGGAGLENSKDYEKVESARLLDASEYTLNTKLGYISLSSQLQDEVLGVAYEFTYGGKSYQVGEFSTDNTESTTSSLYVKLLKGNSLTPEMPFWDLMMKNIYSLGAYSVQKEKFRLDILYQSDTTGTYLNYIPEGQIADQLLLRVMNLDRLDSNQNPYPDGFYDFIDGYTILAESGRVIFPVVEPFGSYLRAKIGNDVIADKYVYQELYDNTLTSAQQIAEKNKFILRGEYKASSGAEIQLGATNVARGSVRVTAGAVELTENVDYTVDYTSGVVTIINENIISSGSSISVSLENQSVYNMQRKTMVGLDLTYQFTPDFSIGGTIMHLSEMPLTTKTSFGDEALKNTLWGLNMSYRTESQWLTNMVDKLPLLTLTKPSQIAFNAEFAHLIAGHYENKYTGGYSYLDDFESSTSGIDLLNPYPWALASTPYDVFPEAELSDNIEYGKNRAWLAWYYIDGIFTRKNSSLLPAYLKADKEQLSNHYVRGVNVTELFPARQQGYNEDNTLQVLNLAYYPNERGPYNIVASEMDSEGYLTNPEKRWGGIMRKIDQSDFETANIEYIQFWLMDPYIYDASTAKGGDLYFNLGDISEDILKDGKKFFENGLPVDGDESQVEYTEWGKVPKQQSTVYAFDNSSNARKLQDVGLNGLSSEEEKEYRQYKAFLDEMKAKLSAEAVARMETDPFSLLNDPAGDDYHHYRGSDYDSEEVDILTRYKRYNGTEGNSATTEDSNESYSTAAKSLPDVEDINQDNTLNETERYYEYRISLRPEDMMVGHNYITDTLSATVTLANGTSETITWYQFKVPVKQPDRTVGKISDFKSIRFMRMYMTGFYDPVILRFGTFQLIRGEWRTYEQDLFPNDAIITQKGTLEVSTVNIEENSTRSPVKYVLPPGVSRALDPSQPQLRQENEQSLSLKVTRLASQDARAIYKTTSYDLRQYKRLQLFTHAEKLVEGEDINDLKDGDFSVFLRLGSDYKNNYYEYEVPLTLTPHQGLHTSETVWPEENMLNFRFEVLTDLKLKRNRIKNEGTRNINFTTLYSEYDPDFPRNTISVIGNPSLAEVKVLMIGVRNNSGATKSGEIWVNELRLTDFEEDGGWAANANLNINLSDLGTVSLAGRIETAGFGGLDQSMAERRLDDFTQYSVATNVELGKFFPEKAQVSIPFYYAYSKEVSSPKYNPLDQDIKLKDALNELETKAERDSLKKISQERSVTKRIAFNNIRVNIRSKNPMPYDPANFSFGYSYSEIKNSAPETTYETTKDYRGNFAYSYTPYARPFRPFQSLITKNNGYTKYAKQLSLNYLPSNISFQTAMMRNYYEIQLRDLSNSGVQNGLLSFSQNFYWDRAFSIRWDLTSSLSASFTSGTNARIEEPYMQVNKKLNPDQYQVWKDSVKQSIRDLGTPMKYDQSFTVTWNAPLQYIPALDWISSSTTYNAIYNWDRGATIDDEIELGNTVRNQRQINIQGNFNFINLYNKNNYLKKVNQKFNPTARTTTRNARPQRPPKALEKEVELNPDSGTVVQHGMLTKKVQVVAKDENGKRYPVKFKALNYGQIMILNKDSVKLNLTLRPGLSRSEDFFTKAAEYSSRFLMSLRRVNVQYGITDGMYITGFRPEIGDIFGQGQTSFGYAPGVGFAFGSVSRRYIDKALERNWLVTDSTIDNAILNSARTLTIQANLEPIYGLKIDLTANRIDTRNTEVNFVYEDIRDIRGGSFSMSTVAIRTAFKGIGNADNGYESKAFNKFLKNRAVIAERLENKYAGTSYPHSGFFNGQPYAGEQYDPEKGRVSQNSADVLIPAFLAAYTGKDPKKSGLSAFPSISSLIPNWRITYDGLIRIPAIKKHFKSFVLSHQYRCTYNVGSYSSYLNWVGDGEMGFRLDVQTDYPIPSIPYEISSVSLSESFSPLLGADATLLNNVTVRADYTTTRNLNLNITSSQIVEAVSNRVTVGLGYKITEFNKILNMRPSRNFSNDLNVRVDFSHTKMQSLIRKIEDAYTQATSGNIAKTIQFAADYGISRALTLRAFYDLQINEPIITSTSYPTSNASYGVSIRFSLAQ